MICVITGGVRSARLRCLFVNATAATISRTPANADHAVDQSTVHPPSLPAASKSSECTRLRTIALTARVRRTQVARDAELERQERVQERQRLYDSEGKEEDSLFNPHRLEKEKVRTGSPTYSKSGPFWVRRPSASPLKSFRT